jgi:hypothetical protein
MDDKSLSPDMEKLIHSLKRGGLAFRRIEAAEKIGRMENSHPRLVLALLRARAMDGAEEVRQAAAAALESPPHRKILEATPGLIEEAKAEERETLKPPVFGWVSFGIAIVSILIIYADIFLLGAPVSGAAPPPIDISPFFCLSFFLSIAGLVFGILGVRQYDRRKTISRLGLLGNGLIIICSLLLTQVVKFYVR